ncbi:interaptin-like isoform X2 [Phycodurus eques]|uniref:interaptin-like isoform X2 n=1 Tax=Phycodurus eques TaxID=693459 RepID=UPI002ACE041F|nr:interaptin-like isoform X2 [Phycodurus eques]
MAGHGWEDWFEREEFIGQISDMRVQNLQVQREVVQKRTFTRWMNLHLEKCNPPIEVQDLFQDIQDGRILMALLEELSGCKLLHGFKKSSHRIFRLNNIAKVLSFLEERNVKLVSIDAVDVVDGNSSIILGLIWNIILFFQIKELTGNIRSQFSSTSSLSSVPTSSNRSNCNTSMAGRQMVTTTTREHSNAFRKLLQWVQKQTRKYGVPIQDFGKSWTSGLAFLAVIKSIDPSLVDMRKALLRNARENLEDAFRIAHYSLGIPRLLEPEDVTISAPDEQSIMTYVSQFLEHFPGMEEQKESYPLIERSISVGRLNFCDHDTHHLGNSVHSSRVRERCIMFQMDCAQPPPQILFSFVPENRASVPPSIQPAISHTWSSEDFLAHSTCMEDNLSNAEENAEEPTEEVLTNLTSNSLQLTNSHSFFDSMLPELVKTESVMGDSAISSPDSWVESEDGVVPEKCCESQRDNSLCDWSTPCDMYCATHVEITCADGGSVPITCEVPDDQSITETYIDEGIFSLNSMDDIQVNVQKEEEKEEGELDYKGFGEKKEVDFKNQTEDILPKPLKKLTLENAHENKDSKFRQTNANYSLKDEAASQEEPPVRRRSSLGAQEGDDTNQFHAYPKTEKRLCSKQEFSEVLSVPSTSNEEQECLKRAMDPVRNSQVNEKCIHSQAVNGVELENECYKTDCQHKQMSANSIGKDEVSLDVDPLVVHCDTDKFVSCGDDNQLESDHTNQAQCFSKTELQPYSHKQHWQQDRVTPRSYKQDFLKQADSQVNEGHFDCQKSLRGVNIDTVFQLEEEWEKTVCSLQDRRKESGENILPVEVFAETQKEAIGYPDLQAKLNTENQYGDSKISSNQNAEGCPVNTEDMSPTTQTAGHHDDPQKNIFDSDNPQPLGKNSDLCYEPLGSSAKMNDFSTDFSHASDFIEPMDLFYPYKREALFPEPLDNKMQSRPSVLSVSALEPAPVCETVPEDQPLYLMDEDFVVKLLKEDTVKTAIKYKTLSTSEQKEQCQLPLGQIRGLIGSVFPPDCSDLSEAQQDSRGSSCENTMRLGPKSPCQNEIMIPPVLRQRNRVQFSHAMDNQTTMTAFSRKYRNGDSEFCWSESWEPYLLFVLWLVLYCLWLLPQMDLKTFPSLLFNINH